MVAQARLFQKRFQLRRSQSLHRLFRHRQILIQLPAACLLTCATLVIGQTLFERVFHYTATLSILIEGIGGIVFLYLLLARKQP